MRVESSITSVSWIPSEAIRGITRLPFDLHFTHYDTPPPDHIDDLDDMHSRGAFRFANHLRAWADVEDGRIIDAGESGRALMSDTLVRLGPKSIAFQPVGFPLMTTEVERTAARVVFEQSAGGRPGVPAPRLVKGRPFVKLEGPNVWTTLRLTINADGTSAWELIGASTFPRHWLYDHNGDGVAKAGMIDFKEWYAHAFGSHSPWSGEQTEAVTTPMSSHVEQQLANRIMDGNRRPKVIRLAAGETLVREGASGATVFLLLDGILTVTVGGEDVAQLGPGAVVGERALFEGARRTATLTAASACRVVQAAEDDLDHQVLRQLVDQHHNE